MTHTRKTHERNRIRRRRGYSLVEMLVVMSISSVVLGSAVVTLVTVLHGQQDDANRRAAQASLARLARQFRLDVRAAESVRSENVSTDDSAESNESPAVPSNDDAIARSSAALDQPTRIICQLIDGAQVVYGASDLGVTRERRQTGEPPHRETFRMARGTAFTLTDPKQTPTGMIEVVISYPLHSESSDDGRRRHVPIRATLGREGSTRRIEQTE